LQLLISVSVVVVLTGLVLGSLGLVKRSQKRVTTTDTLQMLKCAIDMYMDSYARLGDSNDSHDFLEDPLNFLVRRRVASGLQSFLDLRDAQRILATDTATLRWTSISGASTAAQIRGTFSGTAADVTTATHLCDAWGNVIQITIVNDLLNTQPYPCLIEFRSTCGTPSTADDIIMLWTNQSRVTLGRTYPDTSSNWKLIAENKLH
jgi:type II secretory pathway pseudopilin PulG